MVRISFLLVAAALVACTAPADNGRASGPSSSPTASASASPIARPTPTPLDQLLWRLDIPRGTDRYFVRSAPSGRVAVAADLDASSFAFFDLRGSQIAWFDAHGLDIVWWKWLEDSSGLLMATRAYVNGRATTELSVFGPYRGNRTVLGEAGTGPDEPVLSPDGRWLAFATECCPQRIVASRLDGTERRLLFASPARISLLGWDARSRVMYADARQLHWIGLDSKPSDEAAIDLGLPADVNAGPVRIIEQSPDRSAAYVGMFADRAFPGAGSNNYGIRRLVGDRIYEVTSLGQIVGWLNDREFVESRRPPVAVDIVTGSTRSLGVSDDQQQPYGLSGRILLAQGNRSEMYVLRLGVDDHFRSLDVPGNLACCPAAIGDGLFLFSGADGWLYVMNGEVAARP